MDLNSEKQRVIVTAAQEATAMRVGDMEQYLAILCEDAVYMPPNTEAKQGAELRQWLREFVENNVTEWLRFEHGQTVIAADIAFHEYVYTMKVTPKVGGQPGIGYGKGMQILRRETDGAWRILRNIWNARPADSGA